MCSHLLHSSTPRRPWRMVWSRVGSMRATGDFAGSESLLTLTSTEAMAVALLSTLRHRSLGRPEPEHQLHTESRRARAPGAPMMTSP